MRTRVLLLAGTIVAVLSAIALSTARPTAADEEAAEGAVPLQRFFCQRRLGMPAAICRAERRSGGRAIRSRLELDDGRAVYEILLYQPQRPTRGLQLWLDASTGAILETEVVGLAKAERDDEEDGRDESGDGREEAGEGHEKADEDHEEADGQRERSEAAPEELHAISEAFSDRFVLDPADLASQGRNPWFVLEPGYRLVLERRGAHLRRMVVTVLDETRAIGAITARVVEELETVDGHVEERARNYVVISKRTNDVYCLGEDAEGTWEAGKDGARPGLLLPGTPLLGARFAMECAPGKEMDRGRVVDLDATQQTHAGTLTHCLVLEETTPLEPGAREVKVFAPGIGLVRVGELTLVEHGPR